MTVSNTAVNLIHSCSICCSATFLPLVLIDGSCLFANCFDNAGEAQNNFSGAGQREGSGAAPDRGWAVADLSKLWLLGVKGSSTARVLEEFFKPLAIRFLPRIQFLLTRHLRAAGWIAFGWWCGTERYFESLLWFALPYVRSNYAVTVGKHEPLKWFFM